MPFAGLEKVTFMDPETNDRIQINSIDAGLTSFEHGITEDDETTGAAFGGYVYPLVIGAPNLTQKMIDIFEEWAELQTPIHVYGYGPDMFLLWEIGKPIQFRPVDSTNASSGKRKHVVSISHNGYTDKIKWGANLLHLIAPFGPPFTLQNGYFKLNAVTIDPTPSSDGYSVSLSGAVNDGASAFGRSDPIVFPISKVLMGFSVNTIIGFRQNNDDLNYKLTIRDSTFNSLLIVTEQHNGSRNHITFITPANTYSIQPVFLAGGASNGDELFLKNPAIRAGNNSRYTEE